MDENKSNKRIGTFFFSSPAMIVENMNEIESDCKKILKNTGNGVKIFHMRFIFIIKLFYKWKRWHSLI